MHGHCIMTNPSKEGRDFSHVYTNWGANSDDRDEHTRKTKDECEAVQSSTTPPLRSDPAMTYKNFDMRKRKREREDRREKRERERRERGDRREKREREERERR